VFQKKNKQKKLIKYIIFEIVFHLKSLRTEANARLLCNCVKVHWIYVS